MASYNDHGIEDLLCENAIPRYSPANVEFIRAISRLQVRNLLRQQSSIDIGSEGPFSLFNGEQEWVLGELRHQIRAWGSYQ